MITTVDFTYCLISQGSQYLCHSIDTVPIGHVNSSFGHEKVMENHFCKRVVTLTSTQLIESVIDVEMSWSVTEIH